jgi:ABC-type dipeptide/oligopeptide/nickel transport system permease component
MRLRLGRASCNTKTRAASCQRDHDRWPVRSRGRRLLDHRNPRWQRLWEPPWSDILYGIALLGVIVVGGLAGAVTAARSGRLADGAAAGLWSGLVSGTVPMLALVAITLLFPVTVSMDPQNIAEAARSGAPSVLVSAVGDDIVGGINHLWIGPLLGLALGTLGAAARLSISRHQSAD